VGIDLILKGSGEVDLGRAHHYTSDATSDNLTASFSTQMCALMMRMVKADSDGVGEIMEDYYEAILEFSEDLQKAANSDLLKLICEGDFELIRDI